MNNQRTPRASDLFIVLYPLEFPGYIISAMSLSRASGVGAHVLTEMGKGGVVRSRVSWKVPRFVDVDEAGDELLVGLGIRRSLIAPNLSWVVVAVKLFELDGGPS